MTETVTKSVIIKSDPATIYTTLTDFDAYPRTIPGVKAVRMMGPEHVHVELGGPLGRLQEIDLELTRLDPNQRVAWNSKDLNGSVTTSGQITLAPLPETQTEVTATVNYEVSGLGKLLGGSVDGIVERALRELKNVIEAVPGR